MLLLRFIKDQRVFRFFFVCFFSLLKTDSYFFFYIWVWVIDILFYRLKSPFTVDVYSSIVLVFVIYPQRLNIQQWLSPIGHSNTETKKKLYRYKKNIYVHWYSLVCFSFLLLVITEKKYIYIESLFFSLYLKCLTILFSEESTRYVKKK